MSKEGAEKIREESVVPTQRALNALEITTIGVGDLITKLIEQSISTEECKKKIVVLIEEQSQGKISEENVKFVSDHVDKINAAFLERTLKHKLRDGFYSFIAITGKALELVGTACIILGASKAAVGTIYDIVDWCYSNILGPAQKVKGNAKQEAVDVMAKTVGIISQSTGILSTAVDVIGVVVSIGVIARALGSKMQEFKPNTKHVALEKMPEQDKQKLREELIKEISAKMPGELFRHRKEAREKIKQLTPEQYQVLQEGLKKAVEKLRAAKKGELEQNTPEVKQSRFVEMVEGTRKRVNTLEGYSWAEAEQIRKRSRHNTSEVKR